VAITFVVISLLLWLKQAYEDADESDTTEVNESRSLTDGTIPSRTANT
jgi:hypothetical protein